MQTQKHPELKAYESCKLLLAKKIKKFKKEDQKEYLEKLNSVIQFLINIVTYIQMKIQKVITYMGSILLMYRKEQDNQ